MGNLLKRITTGFTIFRLVMKDSKTPFFSKLLVGVALVYLLAPLDFVPDFLSFIGIADDAVIIPLLIITALKLIPPGLIDKYRKSITEGKKNRS